MIVVYSCAGFVPFVCVYIIWITGAISGWWKFNTNKKRRVFAPHWPYQHPGSDPQESYRSHEVTISDSLNWKKQINQTVTKAGTNSSPTLQRWHKVHHDVPVKSRQTCLKRPLIEVKCPDHARKATVADCWEQTWELETLSPLQCCEWEFGALPTYLHPTIFSWSYQVHTALMPTKPAPLQLLSSNCEALQPYDLVKSPAKSASLTQ